MTDIAIKNAILKIHLTIISFILFILLTLSSIVFFLQNGITISSISVPNLKIKNLYLSWDEKLILKCDKINITKSNIKSDEKFDPNNLKNLLVITKAFRSLVKEVDIKEDYGIRFFVTFELTLLHL